MILSDLLRAALSGALLLYALLLPAAAAEPCPASDYHDRGVVSHVFDGDTVALHDGRRVRLLGIDTPETGDDERPPEPLAETAKRRLKSLAGEGVRVRLRYDTVRRDRYGRVLAHVFLESGENVQAQLLAAGLATTLVVPPNEWNHDCYARLERSARAAGRGVWSLASYQPVAAVELDVRTRGFRVVTGRVMRVGEGRKNLWLNLASGFAVRIPKSDLEYFDSLPLRSLLGKRVEIRGRVARRKGELRLTVRHPAALRVLDAVEYPG